MTQPFSISSIKSMLRICKRQMMTAIKSTFNQNFRTAIPRKKTVKRTRVYIANKVFKTNDRQLKLNRNVLASQFHKKRWSTFRVVTSKTLQGIWVNNTVISSSKLATKSVKVIKTWFMLTTARNRWSNFWGIFSRLRTRLEAFWIFAPLIW